MKFIYPDKPILRNRAISTLKWLKLDLSSVKFSQSQVRYILS